MEGRIRTCQGVFLWLEGISLTVSMVGIVPLQLPKLVPPPLAASMMSSWPLVLPVANFNEHDVAGGEISGSGPPGGYLSTFMCQG